jgi:hypothetical protein
MQVRVILSEGFIQFVVLPGGWSVGDETCSYWCFYSIVVNIIQLCAFFGLNWGNGSARWVSIKYGEFLE